MQYLRQSTASQVITIGPFVDKADGFTAEGGLTIVNTEIKLRKNAATSFADKNSGGATHIASGVYHSTLDATDTDTLGRLELFVFETADALPVWKEFMVLPANIYDSMILGSDLFDVSTTQINGGALNGFNADVQLKSLNIENSAGTALRAVSTGSDGHGLEVTGNGTGEGLKAQGGATGHGIESTAGATSGTGILAIAGPAGHGMRVVGNTSGEGFRAEGGTSGNGIEAVAGASSGTGVLARAPNGNGMQAISNGGGGHGLLVSGDGAGEGLHADGGASGHGIEAVGGGTVGDGLHLSVTNGVKLNAADFTGAVTTDGGNSATAFETDRTESDNDYWKDAYLRITSGVLIGQVKKVSAYNGTTKIITLASALTGTPADGVTFDLVNE